MARLIAIDDAQDPRLEPYLDIRERDLVGRDGAFVAEGLLVVETLLTRSRHRPLSVLASQAKAKRLETALARAPADLPVYVASQGVLDAVAGFPIHRGLLALGRRAAEPATAALLAGLRDDARVVIAVGIANHDNVGGLLRNAAAFAAEAVLLDAASCDPLYRKAIRVSMGTALTLPVTRGGDAADLLDAAEAAGFALLALSPGATTRLEDVDIPGRAALVVGAEGPGLPPALIERCTGVRIAMAAGVDSLNVAAATGIALHHLAKGRLR